MLSESYLVDENDLCCSTVTRLRWWVGWMEWASQRAVYQALRDPGKYHTEECLGRTAATMGAEERGLGCKNSGRTGGAAVRPKVDTMVWSKSFGVSDMRDKQGVPCNLPEALLRNPNCWPLGTRTSRDGLPGTQYT